MPSLGFVCFIEGFFYDFLPEGKQITKSWVKNGRVLKDNLDYLDLFLLLIIYVFASWDSSASFTRKFWEMIVWVIFSKHMKQTNPSFCLAENYLLGQRKENFAQPLQSLF